LRGKCGYTEGQKYLISLKKSGRYPGRWRGNGGYTDEFTGRQTGRYADRETDT
jgi:hypothetical protein